MKLSGHQFKSLIKKEWEEIMPIAEPLPEYLIPPEKRSISAIWLNAGAILIFCFLFAFLLYLPVPTKTDFDTGEITITDIKENLIKFTGSKGESI